MSNNYSKQLSTEQITQKLNKLHYHFDDQYWNDFSQQYQGSRMQAVKMSAKFNPKFLAIPVGLIVIASIVYFSINNMRSETATKEPIVTTEKEIAPVVSAPAEKPKQAVVATPVIKDTVKPEIKSEEVPKPVVVEQMAKVKPEKKNVSADSSDKVVSDETARVKKSDTEENTSHKKKKKKKRRSSITSNDAFTPSAEEDNVVIPEN